MVSSVTGAVRPVLEAIDALQQSGLGFTAVPYVLAERSTLFALLARITRLVV